MSPSDAPHKKKQQAMVSLQLNPAARLHVLGTPPILRVGEVVEFTEVEAASLLSVRNRHGVPVVQRVKGKSS